jgi:hypothetical protein
MHTHFGDRSRRSRSPPMTEIPPRERTRIGRRSSPHLQFLSILRASFRVRAQQRPAAWRILRRRYSFRYRFRRDDWSDPIFSKLFTGTGRGQKRAHLRWYSLSNGLRCGSEAWNSCCGIRASTCGIEVMARDKFCTLPTPAEGPNLQLEFGATLKVRPERQQL